MRGYSMGSPLRAWNRVCWPASILRKLTSLPVPRPPELSSPMAAALLVAFAHFITDAYNAFLPPLLPRIMDGLGLSIARHLAEGMQACLTVTSEPAGIW